jgi:hypothetical protein
MSTGPRRRQLPAHGRLIVSVRAGRPAASGRRCGTLGLVAAFDVTRPNTARMYDYWLGGKDNFEVDREAAEAAEAVRASRPDVADLALENKKFLTRAVGYVAGRCLSNPLRH